MSSSPRSIATTLAWKAVGVHDSLRSTCVTGQTSRQNLWPEEKQLYEALRHSSTNAAVLGSGSGAGTGPASVSGWPSSSVAPGVSGSDSASGSRSGWSCVTGAPHHGVRALATLAPKTYDFNGYGEGGRMGHCARPGGRRAGVQLL